MSTYDRLVCSSAFVSNAQHAAGSQFSKRLRGAKHMTATVAFMASVALMNTAAQSQTADNLAAQYTMAAMEQALKTKQHYDLYGLHFAVDQATIQADAQPLLDDIATALKNFPDWRLRIVGHTDATGNAEQNAALSLERASAIKGALVERGIDAQRLDTAGAGPMRPVASNDTDAGRALNRRVELVRFTDSAEAKRLLKAMSDYLAAQTTISFGYGSTLEVATQDDQKLALASSGAVTLNRPDKVRVTRSGGFVDSEILFDGATLTLLGKNVNKFTQVAAAGTVDQLIDELQDKYNRPLPAADLLMSNSYGELMEGVYDSKDLGSGVFNGTECDHLAFRKDEVDLQIWVAQGDRPYPCAFVVTSKLVPSGLQYSIQLTEWKTGDEVAKDDFVFTNPTNAEKIEISELKSAIGDLPGHFTVGDAQ